MSVHGFGATMPERRRTPRTSLEEIVYVDMGPRNGGVVLNVSEGGLAFCAAVPIRHRGVIQFSLLVKGKGRVASSANVVWTDKRCKTCGLRFTPSFEHSGVLLRHWTDASYCPSRDWDYASNSNFPAELPGADACVPALVPSMESAGVSPAPAQTASKPERGPFDPITAEDLATMPQGMSPVAAAALRVAAAILLVFGLVLGAYAYGRQVEDSHFGSLARPDTNAAKPSATTGLKSRAPEPGDAELAAALELLQQAGGTRDASSAVRLLKTAIERGNSTGKVVLAEMYLTGDGLRKSCSEGRRLLSGAAKSGNREAKRKLDELDALGCH